MRDPRRILWKRVVVESITIVASILLAFWIDAAWDRHRESALEREYLLAMRADVLATLELNDDARARQVANINQAKSLLASFASDTNLPPDIRDRFLTFTVPTDQMDTYRDLVSSGNTTVISSSEARASMAAALQAIEYSQIGEDWALKLQVELRGLVLSLDADQLTRDRLSSIWSAYIDAAERLVESRDRIEIACKNALFKLDEALNSYT